MKNDWDKLIKEAIKRKKERLARGDNRGIRIYTPSFISFGMHSDEFHFLEIHFCDHCLCFKIANFGFRIIYRPTKGL